MVLRCRLVCVFVPALLQRVLGLCRFCSLPPACFSPSLSLFLSVFLRSGIGKSHHGASSPSGSWVRAHTQSSVVDVDEPQSRLGMNHVLLRKIFSTYSHVAEANHHYSFDCIGLFVCLLAVLLGFQSTTLALLHRFVSCTFLQRAIPICFASSASVMWIMTMTTS